MISPTLTPSISFTLTLRLEYPNLVGSLRRILTVISEEGGDVGTIEIVQKDRRRIVREVSFAARDMDHARRIVRGIQTLPQMSVLEARDLALSLHDGGKIFMDSKIPLETQNDLSLAYTPAVARVSRLIAEDPDAAWSLTVKRNTVAVVSDGTAVLGLGDIGPAAAMPVMEGKAALFKHFAGVDAWPICLDTKDPEEIIRIVKSIAPSFGGVNLEDISAPRCFEIEERLKKEMDIPVFHDDQHGTAIVVLASLINALKVVGKKMEGLKVVVSGVGASGVACSNILLRAGVKNVIGVDRGGTVYKGRTQDMNPAKERYAERTNPEGVRGGLQDALQGADLFLGLSGPGVLKAEYIKLMGKDPIVFALANPDPEIMPEDAEPYARVIATGRSDYANQINNVLAFPGVFRGALDVRAREINEEMKLAAAHAIAEMVKPADLNESYIIPSVFHPGVAQAVAQAVAKAAQKTGVARELGKDYIRYGL
ncbi:MAG: NAD-dependent malic enzyme [Chloroflexi bacterium]|nr:NAD-dependent malic enzyme [Chloroflexota bacterium]